MVSTEEERFSIRVSISLRRLNGEFTTCFSDIILASLNAYVSNTDHCRISTLRSSCRLIVVSIQSTSSLINALLKFNNCTQSLKLRLHRLSILLRLVLLEEFWQ